MKSADPRIAYFDALAAGWDDEEPSSRTMTARLSEQGDLLSLSSGQELLEVGCGTGKTSAWLAAQISPGRLTAVDFSPEMIQRARRKGIDAEFRCTDVCRDDLGKDLYDVALCFHSFPHFRDQSSALRNLSRAMKTGGCLIVMHIAGSRQINRFHAGIEGPVRSDTLPQCDDWAGLLKQAGMELVSLIDREDLFFLKAEKAVT